ncbi:hypothetical protein QGP82_34785 [Leptothoe sp. LEGE 181152]|nr:hypothetical protein [Leptothoe sp. LEGE 181152]
MGIQQFMYRYSHRWLALACLGSLVWLGVALPVRSQSPQMCINEKNDYLRYRITERTEWGRIALDKGYIQSAVEHLTQGLELSKATDSNIRAGILENFILENGVNIDEGIREVDTLIKLGDTAAARTVLTSANTLVQGIPDDYRFEKSGLLTKTAAGYAALGEQTTALDLLSQARQLAANVQGAGLQTTALTMVGRQYAAVGAGAIAIEVANQALQQAETINPQDSDRQSQTLAAIAVIYAEAGDIGQALQLAKSIEQPYAQENAMGSIALSAARLGQMDQAADLVQQLTLDEPTIEASKNIGVYLAKRDDQAQAQLYFDQAITAIANHGYPGPLFTETMLDAGLSETTMKALAVAPGGQFKVDGLMDLATYYANVENNKAVASDALQQAMTATAEVEQDYMQRDLWEKIYKRAIELENYDLALAAVDMLVAKGLSFNEIEDYTTIAVAAAKSGQIESALKATEQIDPSYIANTNRAWGEIAVAYAVAGDFDTAFTTVEKTKSFPGPDYVRALVRIGLQQQQGGLLEAADVTVEQAHQVAQAIDNEPDQLIALNAIALEHARMGLTEAANNFLEPVLVTLKAQSTDDLWMLQPLVEAWAEIGEYGFAVQMLDAVPEEYPESPRWKTWLVDRLIEDQEDYATALEVIESREDSAIKAAEMMRVAELYFRDGKTDQTLKILNRVANASEVGVDQWLRMAELYSYLGQTESIVPLLDRAFEVAKTVPGEESQVIYLRENLAVDDEQDRGSLYEKIAVAYGRNGSYDRGLAVAEQLQDTLNRNQTMDRLNCYRDF